MRYYQLAQTSTGIILASYARDQGDETHEYLAEPEIDFASWNGTAWVEDANLVSQDYERQVANTDAAFIRGIEDIIDVLTSTGTITLEDLPDELVVKYNARKALRENI